MRDAACPLSTRGGGGEGGFWPLQPSRGPRRAALRASVRAGVRARGAPGLPPCGTRSTHRTRRPRTRLHLPHPPRAPRDGRAVQAQVQALEEENAALRREVERLRAALAGRQAQDGGAERSAAPEDDFGRRSTTAVREKAAREVAAAFAQVREKAARGVAVAFAPPPPPPPSY